MFEVEYTKRGVFLTQAKCFNELLAESGITSFKSVATPLPLNLKLYSDSGQFYQDPGFYKTLVGKLNFLINTRPELAYLVQKLSQFMHSPRLHHFDAL